MSGQTNNEMEVEESNAASAMETTPIASNAKSVMASSGTVGSVSISLHPLVIMNVSEHWTRLRAQEGSDQLGKIRKIIDVIFVTSLHSSGRRVKPGLTLILISNNDITIVLIFFYSLWSVDRKTKGAKYRDNEFI